MAEGRPPNNDIKSMKQLTLIPNRPPPSLQNPKMWSMSVKDFLSKCITKDRMERPGVLALLGHPFITESKGAQALMPLVRTCLNSKKPSSPRNAI